MRDILSVIGLIIFFALLSFMIAPEDTAYTIGHAIYTFKTALAGG